MAVHAAAKRAFLHRSSAFRAILEAHNAFKLIESLFRLIKRSQIVTRGKGMAGINTYAHAGFILHAVNNGRQMFELKAEVTALAGGVLDDRRHALGFIQRDVDGSGNARQTGIFVNLHQMTSRMEVQQRQSKLLAALHFIKKSLAGFLQRLLHGMAEVNEIAVVGKDLTRP